MNKLSDRQSHPAGMIFFAKDLPNICSLAGLLCALLGVYFAILQNFKMAIIGMIWAVLFDWADGIIARKMKGRTDMHRQFGGQLDSLIDMVSFGICPAVFLLSYGNFSPWFLPGAFVIVSASAIRLSYFNVFGLIDDSTYMGLALDNNTILFAFIFLFEGLFNSKGFSIITYTIFMVMAVLNLSPVRTPKFSGKWFYALLFYAVVLTIIYGWMLWSKA
ncbi:CDP-alcohol phosphatidyltransferase family protein [Desulfobacula phenolica]|uniref:CDP-diacylglycerol---serine O-phosphatidyltransferase n=1 Tax=Desulfobacula phenolica TaxID=90732 RepID=A0A1H2IFS3_9BACT|nr:CDP-alcohol phosphatidyltransferase family protein [Desulfobacula phenolica]SDU42944.1 CDP-diacylglycerol---serine O-phosphatidyltransferase [Desulfobacula phenolica]